MRHIRLIFTCLCLLAAPVLAAPARYSLDERSSSVGFETDFGANQITGRMPVSRADLTLDFEQIANSTVEVTLDVTGAKASFPFAAQAMKGPKVLDATRYPEITFASTSVRATGDSATVKGNVTIRGITRPLTLKATIWRQQGTEPGDRRHLTVRLIGKVNRSAFGATGYDDLVSDEVRLDILARISLVD